MMYDTSKDARDSFLEEIGAGFFGEFLISQGLIERSELDAALEAQQKLVNHLKIGELLVKRGSLQPAELIRALQEYRIGIRLGELLIHQGDISFLQLLDALDYQQAQACQLGEALIRLGHCTAEQIDEVLTLQKSLAAEA